MEKVIESLKSLGFNTYEARVYVGLLKKYPATAYEVSKSAKVPQPRTYDTLKVLADKQIVIPSTNKPVQYTPIKPSELTKKYKRKINTNIEYLEKHLPQIKDDYVEPIHTIKGIDDIKSKLVEIINNAKKEIYIEIWSEDFKYLEPYLRNAYNKNVEIRMVGYNNFKSNFGLVYEHPYSQKLEKYFNGRIIALSSDEKEAFYGRMSFENDDNPTVVWTKNKDMIFLIKEMIVHDMFILDIQETLPNELTYAYGKGLKRLYDRILGLNNIYKS